MLRLAVPRDARDVGGRAAALGAGRVDAGGARVAQVGDEHVRLARARGEQVGDGRVELEAAHGALVPLDARDERVGTLAPAKAARRLSAGAGLVLEGGHDTRAATRWRWVVAAAEGCCLG